MVTSFQSLSRRRVSVQLRSGARASLCTIDVGEGRPILLLHGNPTSSAYYRNLIPTLAKRNRVIALDHLGCGESDRVSLKEFSFRLEDHIENLRQVVHQLELRDITLIMHDWGGAIGSGFAVSDPERIHSLVLSNTAAFTAKKIPFLLALGKIPYLGRAAIQGFNLFAKAATHLAVETSLPGEIKRIYTGPHSGFRNALSTWTFVRDIPLTPQHPSFATLQRIENGLSLLKEKPSLLVWGGKDWVFDRSFFERWQKILPQAESLWIPYAGHWVLEDAGAIATQRICEFLNEHP